MENEMPEMGAEVVVVPGAWHRDALYWARTRCQGPAYLGFVKIECRSCGVLCGRGA